VIELEASAKESVVLILTRKAGEVTYIGHNVTVRVLGIKGHQVRLGFEAPAEVEIHREEVYRKIMREKSLIGTQGNRTNEERSDKD
jgi:carbon storage regulator